MANRPVDHRAKHACPEPESRRGSKCDYGPQPQVECGHTACRFLQPWVWRLRPSTQKASGAEVAQRHRQDAEGPHNDGRIDRAFQIKLQHTEQVAEKLIGRKRAQRSIMPRSSGTDTLTPGVTAPSFTGVGLAR